MTGITVQDLKDAGVEFEIYGDKPKGRGKPGKPEEKFLDGVMKAAKLHGWKRAHFRVSQSKVGWRTAVSGDGAGFPDLLLIHEVQKRIIVAELKAGKNVPSDKQKEWLRLFALVGIPAYVWYPKDLDTILEILK